MPITITLPDGSKKKVEANTTGLQLAESIGPRLAKAALAVKLNGELAELNTPITKDSTLEILTFDNPDGKAVFWHSAAHILAQAVLKLWPDTKLTIGPPIENGFYYDFDKTEPFTPDNLKQIEEEMKGIIKQDAEVKREEVTANEAKKRFKDNPYKVELIEEFSKENKNLTIYHQGDFQDLCRGGHVQSTGIVKAIALTKISSAYWRGDQKNKSLQRIYGIAFPKQKDLDNYLHMMEEAEKRDHRKIGTKLDLFSFHDVSPGSPFFHPKGTFIFNTLATYMRHQYQKRGYHEVATPQIFHKDLWETSGHWQHYQENMFITEMDGQDTAVKPMNCPSHIVIYKTKVRSYRELPLRLADFGPLHRNELRGTLGGLFRVRRMQQDDAHIFCTEEQIEKEVQNIIEFIRNVYKTFNFEFHVELSTMPEKAVGDKKLWKKAEEALESALKKAKLEHKLNPGDGAFYGPKIDFHIKDALGRTWQCATIQLDFNLPERFNIEYDAEDGKRHQPVMLHRAIFGSIERFMGILIEHYAGRLPLWLNPNQVIVLPISDRHNKYAESVAQDLKDAGIRADINIDTETTNKKIYEAQSQQYNYILVVGDKEQKAKTINVRTRDEKVHGETKVEKLISDLQKEIADKK